MISRSLASALLLSCCLTACKNFDFNEWRKKEKFPITVHAQGTDMDSPRSIFRMPIPGKAKPMVFNLVPEFSSQNVAAVHVFPASNGNGNGISLKLDFRGAEALHMATRTRPGEVLLTMVGGHPVDYVTVDRPVTDGIFTIWEGLPDEVVEDFKKRFPPISKLKSMSGGQEMLPTTRGEKRRAKEEADAAARKEAREARDREAGAPGAIQAPAAPQAPAPLPAAPQGNGLPPIGSNPRVPVGGNRQDQPLPAIPPR